METALDTISKNSKKFLWEVHGHSEFSPDGVRTDWIQSTVLVKAGCVGEAARNAIELMGYRAKVEKVFQCGYGVLGDT